MRASCFLSSFFFWMLKQNRLIHAVTLKGFLVRVYLSIYTTLSKLRGMSTCTAKTAALRSSSLLSVVGWIAFIDGQLTLLNLHRDSMSAGFSLPRRWLQPPFSLSFTISLTQYPTNCFYSPWFIIHCSAVMLSSHNLDRPFHSSLMTRIPGPSCSKGR